MVQFDVASRIAALTDAFGEAGIVALFLLAVLLIIYLIIRGTGPTILLLLVCYSLIFVEQGGINTAAFFGRTLALVLLALSAIRRLVVPGRVFGCMIAYALLAFACSVFAPRVDVALQQGGLLIVTIVGVSFGLSQYLTSYEKVDKLFRMFAVSGVVWTVASALFVRDFVHGTELRFTAGSGVHATTYAVFGALLLPFMLWVTIRKGGLHWRLAGLVGLVGIPICIFLSGTRTAIVIAVMTCAPLFWRRQLSKTAVVWAFGLVLGVSVLFVGRYVLRDRSTEFLTQRVTQTGLSGRQELWSQALTTCLQSPVLGRGVGADGILSREANTGLFHNAYLAIWCNAGILGLLFVLVALGLSLMHAWQLMRWAPDTYSRDVTRFVFGYLLALAALGCVENSFSSPSNAMIASLIIMMTLISRMRHLMLHNAAYRLAAQQRKRAVRPPALKPAIRPTA